MSENRAHILVVDDEPLDLTVVQRSLESCGYAVFLGSNYDEGLAAFEAHANEIDLLITDISLPGKTGLELARVCLRKNPALKILLISGWVGSEFLEYVGIAKSDPHFLPKPFRSSKLLDRVQRILESTDQTIWLDIDNDKTSSGSAGS